MRAVPVFGLATVAVVLAHQSTCATPRPVVITPADRVRIQTIPDSSRVPTLLRGKFTGSITDMNTGAITVLMEGGQPAVVHRNLIAGIETSVDYGSRGKHVGVGMLIGAAVGALVFGIGASAADDSDSFIKLNPAGMALLGAMYGSPVGALVGALFPAGRGWVAVPLESVEWKPESTREE